MEDGKEGKQGRDSKNRLTEGVCPDKQNLSRDVLSQKELLPKVDRAADKESRTPRHAGGGIAYGGEPACFPCPCAEEEYRDVRGDAYRLEDQHIAVEGPCVGMEERADDADTEEDKEEEGSRDNA